MSAGKSHKTDRLDNTDHAECCPTVVDPLLRHGGALGTNRTARDVARSAVAIAIIRSVLEGRTEEGGLVPSRQSLLGSEAGEVIRLVQAPQSMGDVIEFLVDGMLDLAHPDDQAEDEERGHENKFR